MLAAKNTALEVHDSDDESNDGASAIPIDMTTAFTVLNPIEVLSNAEALVDECIANLEGDWAQTMCYPLAVLFHCLAFNNGVRPDSTAKPVASNGTTLRVTRQKRHMFINYIDWSTRSDRQR